MKIDLTPYLLQWQKAVLARSSGSSDKDINAFRRCHPSPRYLGCRPQLILIVSYLLATDCYVSRRSATVLAIDRGIC